MRLSRTVAYALQATMHLARPDAAGTPTPCSRLAAEGKMPERFLLQVLQDPGQARHSAVHSRRRRGLRLERSPADISLLEVIEALDGPVVPTLPDSRGASQGIEGEAGERSLASVTELDRRELHSIKLAHLLPSGDGQPKEPEVGRRAPQVHASGRTLDTMLTLAVGMAPNRSVLPAPAPGPLPLAPVSWCMPIGLAHLELLAEVDALVDRLNRWAAMPPPGGRPRSAGRGAAAGGAGRRAAGADRGPVGSGYPWRHRHRQERAGERPAGDRALVRTGRSRPTTEATLICRPGLTPEMLGIDPACVELIHSDLPGLAGPGAGGSPGPGHDRSRGEGGGERGATSRRLPPACPLPSPLSPLL